MSARTKITQCVIFHMASEYSGNKLITVSRFGIVAVVITGFNRGETPILLTEKSCRYD